MYVLQIGPLRFSCNLSAEEIAPIFAKSIVNFIKPESCSKAPFSLQIDHIMESIGEHLKPFEISFSSNGKVASILTRQMRSSCDLETSSINIELNSKGAVFLPIRFFSALLLPRHQFLLLHAATVVRGENAYIFSGESGAGKTTLSHISHQLGHRVLTDDTTALGFEEQHSIAWGTPFSGEGNYAENAKAPVKGLFYLTKSMTNTITELDQHRALRFLLRNTMLDLRKFSPTIYQQTAALILKIATDLTAQIPSYLLEFSPGPEIWSLLP